MRRASVPSVLRAHSIAYPAGSLLSTTRSDAKEALNSLSDSLSHLYLVLDDVFWL